VFIFLSSACNFSDEIVGQEEQNYKSNNDVTHEFSVAFSRTDHVINSVHTPCQQTLTAVKLIHLKKVKIKVLKVHMNLKPENSNIFEC
jgi:hypothetical protein